MPAINDLMKLLDLKGRKDFGCVFFKFTITLIEDLSHR